MPAIPVDSLDDIRLRPYRNMKEKELARDGNRFIAEGENVVRRLLRSGVATQSVLISERKRAAIAPLVREDLPLYCASDALIEQIIGFDFHSGVLACGIRPQSPALVNILPAASEPSVVVACQEITNAENMGGLIRIAAAFGASAVLVGERCCDPYFRQSVRVSMGTIFALPLVRSKNLLADLDWLATEGGFVRVASVLDHGAKPLWAFKGASRVVTVFGSEAQGLDTLTIVRCDERLTIPMKLGTDSLNVVVAAGVFLFQLTSSKPITD
ncbi:MAG: RNA methyltransferase [Planctomycetota bacterium]|nr:RNA methyltransferase [Planctomycetota bacterium]